MLYLPLKNFMILIKYFICIGHVIFKDCSRNYSVYFINAACSRKEVLFQNPPSTRVHSTPIGWPLSDDQQASQCLRGRGWKKMLIFFGKTQFFGTPCTSHILTSKVLHNLVNTNLIAINILKYDAYLFLFFNSQLYNEKYFLDLLKHSPHLYTQTMDILYVE